MSQSPDARARLSPAEAPNYTQSPNVFYDEWLPHIKSLAELKVVNVLIRYTFGWHKDAALFSASDFCQLTGLSEPSVLAGVRAALEHKIIGRLPYAGSFLYFLVVEGFTPTPESIDDGSLRIFRGAPKESLGQPLKNLGGRPYRERKGERKTERKCARASTLFPVQAPQSEVARARDTEGGWSRWGGGGEG